MIILIQVACDIEAVLDNLNIQVIFFSKTCFCAGLSKANKLDDKQTTPEKKWIFPLICPEDGW